MKVPKTWSVISESPRNSVEEVKKQSQAKKESEKMIKVEEKKIESEKLIEKKQTPKP